MNRKLYIPILFVLLIALSSTGAGANPYRAGIAYDDTTMTQSAAPATEPMTPVGSGFTYQGRLLDGGNPANGLYDLRFTLFDAATGGNQIGTPITLLNQTVTNGLFTVTLDFGTTAFRGDARFLQIEVQHNGTGYVPLSPRQPLTPAPYAMSLMPGAVISANTSSNVLTASNNGTGIGLKGIGTSGSGVEGDSTSGVGVAGYTSSSSAAALAGTNFGSGPGISAISSTGTGVNAQGRTSGVYGVGIDVNAAGVSGVANSGTGAAGLYGTSTTGFGAVGISTASNGKGMYGVANTGVNAAGVSGASTFGYGVYGTGAYGVRGETTASGYGVYGLSPGGNGVFGTSTSGTGVAGSSNTGVGVKGQASAAGSTGVKAQGNGSGTAALWIDNGAIRVTNAGNETNSPVFQHVVHTGTGGNTCSSNYYSFIDNPYTNGDPNAILLITPSYRWSGLGSTLHSAIAIYADVTVGNCPINKWLIGHIDESALDNYEPYNVMVIKP
jgi:hypothetical protein